jgi:hypothetical protein
MASAGPIVDVAWRDRIGCGEKGTWDEASRSAGPREPKSHQRTRHGRSDVLVVTGHRFLNDFAFRCQSVGGDCPILQTSVGVNATGARPRTPEFALKGDSSYLRQGGLHQKVRADFSNSV